MAKKSKKVTKKTTTTKHSHHHWHPHEFLLVVAGGFVIIVFIFLLSGSGNDGMKNAPVDANAAAQMDEQKEVTVTISEFTYSQDPIVVKKGTTVIWTNNDTVAHSATADDGSFDTGFLENGESGSVTFREAGEYTYHCSVHPNMTGKVIVEE